MASYASTVDRPEGLILESGFPSARSLLAGSPILFVLSVASTYRFPSAAFLQRRSTSIPVLVLHGDDDHVVPMRLGRALFELMSEPKEFVAIRGGDHNDVTPADPAIYWEAVNRFVTGLPRQ
jgi:uncharacterized protein